MRHMMCVVGVAVVGLVLSPAMAEAACPADSVESGTVCMDKYEASVWYVPPQRTILINRIQKGTVTLANLTSAGAVAAGVVQLGLAEGDLASHVPGCPNTGNGCVDFYAVSIPGVIPATWITWFQAAAVARNSLKRLPTNQEWQVAALGTPDGGGNNPPCVVHGSGRHPTGTAGCVSDVGAFDMVGNVSEWVADWVPGLITFGAVAVVIPLFPGNTNVNTLDPVALLRGGYWDGGARQGVFTMEVQGPSDVDPLHSRIRIGFRPAR